MQVLQLSLDDNILFSIFYIWGDFWSLKQATTCTLKQNANLPEGDKGTTAFRRQTENVQMLSFCCYIDACCAWKASSLNWISRREFYFQIQEKQFRKGEQLHTKA